MFGKGSKYSFNGDDNLDCEFLTSTFEDGYPYNVGLVNHFKKEVSPCHGYYYPNRRAKGLRSPCHGYYYPNRFAKGLMNYALKLGYTYVDSEMPSTKNKTLLKKWYKSGKKEEIFVGQIKEISPSMGVLDKYEIVDIITQKFERGSDATWYLSHVAMKKI